MLNWLILVAFCISPTLTLKSKLSLRATAKTLQPHPSKEVRAFLLSPHP